MKKFLLTGADGMLGRAIATSFVAGPRSSGDHRVESYTHGGEGSRRIEIENGEDVRRITREHFAGWKDTFEAAWIINCAAYTDVDGAERNRERAFAVNSGGVANLVKAADEWDVRVLHLSTDYVFGGAQPTRAPRPWREEDPVGPRGVYAQSKLAGEQEVLASPGRHLLVRTSWLFGMGGKNFLAAIVDRARAGLPLSVVDDQRGSPTYADDLAEALARLVEAGASGVYHAANDGECTWHELACEALRAVGLAGMQVTAISTADLGRPAPRPAYSVLDTTKLARETRQRMPSWQNAVSRYLAAREERPLTA